MIINSRN